MFLYDSGSCSFEYSWSVFIMRNILITISYDGTNYVGWQSQQGGRSIEQAVKKAVERLVGEEVTIYGSGRTDSKVHAIGQTASFYTSSSIDIEKIPFGINNYLNKDIRVISAVEVGDDFHARYSAKGKEYIYYIYNKNIMNPIFLNKMTHIFYYLDIDKMREAAYNLIGVHDFKGFSKKGSNVKSTIREIYDIDIQKDGNIISIKISGSGFLYNMVRIIVATLVDIGRGKFEVERVEEILKTGDRNLAKVTLGPEGLYLNRVFYDL